MNHKRVGPSFVSTVLMQCLRPLCSVDGSSVTTIEALSKFAEIDVSLFDMN